MEHSMEFLSLLLGTITLRPYVFVFLAVFLFSASKLIGWRRTAYFWGITYIASLLCELISTRTGIPFGWYHYNGSTIGRELYVFDIPAMNAISFPFILFASYCMALAFLLPAASTNYRLGMSTIRMGFSVAARTGWPVMVLTILFFVLIDIVIDPVTLRGDRWFLGQIYHYHNPGAHFGVPITNYMGWVVVGFLSLRVYLSLDRKLLPSEAGLLPAPSVTARVLLGCALYYGILIFNLLMTFWIEELLIGITGLFIYLPVTVLLAFRLLGHLSPCED